MDNATPDKSVHFEFLDAFRGLTALMVVLQHSVIYLDYKHNKFIDFDRHDFIQIAAYLTTPFAMSGFFLLSSFLLTYRLYDEMDKTPFDLNQYALILAKYFIRRFMRIYVVYFIYCSIFSLGSYLSTGLLKEVIDKMLPPCTWFGLVTLTQTGMHLWTIPIEIIYYFIIPIICLACKAASSRAISKAVFVIGLTVFSYLGCNYNLTELTQDEVNRYKYKGIVTSFKLTAFIFVSGSLIGILVHNMQENSVCNTLLKWNAVQLGISLLSMIQFARAYKTSMWKVGDDYLTFIHIPGFQWAIFLFLLIIGDSKWNPFVALLEKSLNLQKCGKYSFGIYLNLFLVDKWDHINWMSMPEKTVIVLFVVYLTGWLWYFVFEKNLIILANRFCEFLVKKSNKYQILVENI